MILYDNQLVINHSLEVEKVSGHQWKPSECLSTLHISYIPIIYFFRLSHCSGHFVLSPYFCWLTNVFQGSFGQYRYILSLYQLCSLMLKTQAFWHAGLPRSTDISDLYVIYSSKYCCRSCSGQSLPSHLLQARLNLLLSVKQLKRQ